MIEQAQAERDAQTRTVKEALARQCQRAWGCPYGELQDDAALALTALERTIGATLPRQCPVRTIAHPSVQRAVRAYRWWTRGALTTIEPMPSQALCDAIDAIDMAARACEHAELDRLQASERQ